MYVIRRGIVALSHAISTGVRTSRAPSQYPAMSLSRGAGRSKKGPRRRWRARLPGLVFSRIFTQERRVLLQYETSHKKSITSIVFTGGGGVAEELGAYAKSTFSIDVRIADPF